MENSEIPKLSGTINVSNYIIDATPDGNYALRILRFYRELTNINYVFESNTIGKETHLYAAMNALQNMRAKELDLAIKTLESVMK
jgi:hypothetical protein